MADSATANQSLALYWYICQNIVGTEEHVKNFRMMNSVRDNLTCDNCWTTITSGSFGEGLDLKDSDLDIMSIMNCFEVVAELNIRFKPNMTYFLMATEATKPGYTQLRLVHGYPHNSFEEIAGEHYVSNSSFKPVNSNSWLSIVHGPCVSDKLGYVDIAFCLRSKAWASQANQWIFRPGTLWPHFDLKHRIIKHGVLLVPVGVKGSTKEHLEWRISFSVAEKLLIYTFTHSQFICYALLKILLKDIIADDLELKDVLCSYFMKTILFWISEESPLTIWTPEKLIYNFMKCFKRLIYCVEYCDCPSYFIPDNNLFENKITGHVHEILLNKLRNIYSCGWQCIVFSDRIKDVQQVVFGSYESPLPNGAHLDNIKLLIMSCFDNGDVLPSNYNFTLKKGLKIIYSIRNSKIKYLYLYYISKLCCNRSQLLPTKAISSNKSAYKQYKRYLSSLMLNTNHDAVSGWLMLPSFFYKTNQYSVAITILQYSLLKCSPDKLCLGSRLTSSQEDLLNLDFFKKMKTVRLLKFMLLERVFFHNSVFIPRELELTMTEGKSVKLIPPVVFAHFLRFLSHFRLKNSRQCQGSFRDLQLTVKEDYFIAHDIQLVISYVVLGIAYQLIGEKEYARQAFIKSIEFHPDEVSNSAAFQRLSLMI
ncbi:uncharacterized protein [Mytilus edulis]|uniref:uncharacterized protein n=1 Tax=Mytilus edulis TaxID=6550 RepID=UPI0039F11653